MTDFGGKTNSKIARDRKMADGTAVTVFSEPDKIHKMI